MAVMWPFVGLLRENRWTHEKPPHVTFRCIGVVNGVGYIDNIPDVFWAVVIHYCASMTCVIHETCTFVGSSSIEKE